MNGDIWKKIGAALGVGGVIFSAGGAWVSLQQNSNDIKDLRQDNKEIRADFRRIEEKLDRVLLFEKGERRNGPNPQ